MKKRPSRGATNPEGIGGFQKGVSGNPGGLTKDQRQARDWVRDSLKSEKEQVHNALLALVKGGNPQAVIYAHQALAGKDPDKFEFEDKTKRTAASGMTTKDALELSAVLRNAIDLAERDSGGALAEGRAMVSSGQEPDGPARGPLVKS